VIARTIAFCARNRFAVLVSTAVAIAGAVYCVRHIPLDAIPDLTDTQVIVYSRWDRSPDIVEDQVTYPIVTAMLGAPGVNAVRAYSDFGYSFVTVIFAEGTDLYWARSRTTEYLGKILPRLPEGVRTELGPDATGLGWVYQYALVDESGTHSLADMRSFQDWYLRYWIQSVPGVAEVASIGGFQKQYQVNLDPNRLRAYGIPLARVVAAIRQGNADTGGRLLEIGGAEYMVRGRGYARSTADFASIAVSADANGTPILVGDLGTVSVGPEIRRGVADLNGIGDTAGGIVIMRDGENALNVIDRVKAKLAEVAPSLPAGARIVTTYDRSELIRKSLRTLINELVAALVVVSLVILIFLWHVPSAIVPIVTIPTAILLAFIPMYFMRVTANIMSLAGIIISIGVLVDGAIVEVENAYKKIQVWIDAGRPGDFHAVRLRALQEVGPSVFFSLLVIAVAFMPIFTLEGQEGRLFKPLAYTKNLTMAIAAVLAITLDPAVRMLFSRADPIRRGPRPLAWLFNKLAVGAYVAEERHPISRLLFALYEGPCRFVVRHRVAVIALAAALVAAAVPLYLALGSEFMPPLWEGDLLYMPTTFPGISLTEAQRLMQAMDRILKTVPEVDLVFGKAGRAETSTDPAPLSMLETTILLKPESQWRPKERWYARWPAWAQVPFRRIWPDRISKEELIRDLDAKMQFPGVTNAWTMPIKARIDMLSTGVRTPVAVKILGGDLAEIEEIGTRIEAILKELPGTRSALAERTTRGFFLDFDLRRAALARYGLTIEEAQAAIRTAIGGEPITTTVEGRERYTVNVRYAREFRDDLDALARVLVPAASGAQVPLGELAELKIVQGPGMIRNENGMLAGHVYVDVAGRDVGTYVEEAKAAVAARVPLPAGCTLLWSGQYEHMLRVKEHLKTVIPLTLFLIFVLLYLNTRSAAKTCIVLLAVPFSAIGAIAFLHLLGYHISIAVWVGIIALMGLDAETGVFMLLYLDLAYYERVRAGKMRTFEDLTEAIVHGAVKRIRPKLMTVSTAFVGLLPIMWSTSTGADMMQRVAAPLMGGLLTSFILELLVYPPVYAVWKWRFEMRRGAVDVAALPIPELRGH